MTAINVTLMATTNDRNKETVCPSIQILSYVLGHVKGNRLSPVRTVTYTLCSKRTLSRTLDPLNGPSVEYVGDKQQSNQNYLMRRTTGYGQLKLGRIKRPLTKDVV